MPNQVPLRVALFTQQISPYHAARYRAARQLLGDLRIFSLVNGADFEEFLSRDPEADNVVRLFNGVEAYERAMWSGALWRKVNSELHSFNPEVVAVAGWSFPESFAAICWARRAGARVALMSASQTHDAPRTPLREAVKRRVVSACDAALVAAGPHADYVSSLGIPNDRVFFGYDAVDNAHFGAGADRARAHESDVRAAHGLPRRYLLASGRFIGKKNLPRLVEAFSMALRQGDSGHDLVILGGGEQLEAIRASIRTHGVDERVHLPGFRPYVALPDYYGLADGFVHVALAEQWGLVINEAAAAGLPLVVTRTCGAAAALVREGANGFLVEPTATAQIAAAIQKLMSLTASDRTEMGRVSRAVVAEWGPERYARGLYSACTTAGTSPPRALAPLDRVLFHALAYLRIASVS